VGTLDFGGLVAYFGGRFGDGGRQVARVRAQVGDLGHALVSVLG
jgi:hypothetical protein